MTGYSSPTQDAIRKNFNLSLGEVEEIDAKLCESTTASLEGKRMAYLQRFLYNSAGRFPADSENRRKQLPTKVLAGNPNPQENLQEKGRFLVGLCQKKET
ncbi:hypothetical protein QL285_016445 [Trifolium repens]|nr:hypothetical protein QL285_016445 [Trifolium repens]